MPNVNPNSISKVPVNNTKASQPKVMNQNPSIHYDNAPHQEDDSQGFTQKPNINQSYPPNQNDWSSQGPSYSQFNPNANYSQPKMNLNNTGVWSRNSSKKFQNFGGGFQKPNCFPGVNQNTGVDGQRTNSASGFNRKSTNQYPGFGGQGANQFQGFGGQGPNMPFWQQMGPCEDNNGNTGYWAPNPLASQMYFRNMYNVFQSTTTPPPQQNYSAAEEIKVPEEKKQDINKKEEIDDQEEKNKKDEAKNKQEEKKEVRKNELEIEVSYLITI
jgi:hypothetical protein